MAGENGTYPYEIRRRGLRSRSWSKWRPLDVPIDKKLAVFLDEPHIESVTVTFTGVDVWRAFQYRRVDHDG